MMAMAVVTYIQLLSLHEDCWHDESCILLLDPAHTLLLTRRGTSADP